MYKVNKILNIFVQLAKNIKLYVYYLQCFYMLKHYIINEIKNK